MRFGYLCNFGITSSPTHHYQYDDVGNRTSVLDLGVTKSYGANSVNAYTSISGFAAPVHDANGNMNSGPLGVVGAATSALTYGKENNNLLSASGTQATNFVYDAMGRFVQFSYTVNSVTKTEILSWAGWTLMTREIFTGNAVSESHRYTWGTDLSGTMEGAGGVGGLLAVERNVAGSNIWDIRYTHADANGNIIALTNSSGNVSARYRYDAFGKVLSATDVDNSGWVNHNIHGFSSKPSFGNQGLLYYGYRWYSPSLGRWINRDPIEENGGMNLYGFVGNRSVGKWDYLGLVGGTVVNTKCENLGESRISIEDPSIMTMLVRAYGKQSNQGKVYICECLVKCSTCFSTNYSYTYSTQTKWQEADRKFISSASGLKESLNNMVKFAQKGNGDSPDIWQKTLNQVGRDLMNNDPDMIDMYAVQAQKSIDDFINKCSESCKKK